MTTITLTFDNGPDPDITPRVLDTLRRHGIKSTFFVLGEKLRDRRGLAERVRDEGHWVGNHTYNHIVPLGMSTEAGFAVSEIARTQELIGGLAHERKFFRPFGGGGNLDQRLLNREALDYLRKESFTCVLWHVIPEDWVRPEAWVQCGIDLCFKRDHSVVVLHDLATGAMRELDRFISAAKDRGASFQQDFPPDCVMLERGKPTRSVDAYVSEYIAAI